MTGRETDDYLEVLLSRHRRRQGAKYRTDTGSVNLDQIIQDKTGYKPRTVSFLPSVESRGPRLRKVFYRVENLSKLQTLN